MRKLFYIAVAVTGLGACAGDQIVAPNLNNPDVARVLARPGDVETVVGNSFGSAYQAAQGATGGSGIAGTIEPALLTMSFESSSALANDAMGPRGSLPRAAIANNSTDTYAGNNAYNYQGAQRAARTAANGLVQLKARGFTLGNPNQDFRARAFAYFAMAFGNATVAIAYDSLSVVSELDTIANPPAKFLSGLQAMPIILTQLDSAIANANSAIALGSAPSGAGGGLGFTLQGTWVNGNAFTATQFIQMVRGYKARFRAEVARTPADRAAVDWSKVIADANAGLPTDLNVNMLTTSPWRVADEQHYVFDTWTQQSPMIIGMADSVRSNCSAANQGDPNGGSCYDAWLATSLGSRYAFLIQTADQRFPQGTTRATQQNNSGAGTAQQPPRTNLYFRNRRASDPPGDPWTLSQYDYYHYQLWNDGGRTGAYPIMTRAELDLLAAEGYIRTGDFANAMAKINITRVAKGNLPPLTGITSLTQPIATGIAANSCVPRIPTGPDYAHATCGNIFEAMKWEKRMETMFTHLGDWFFDSRGWGDLALNTALDFPVPYQETDVRARKAWTTGGAGGKDAAALGTYGY
ncbi:MAG: hypothetical protein M3R65_01305 [Gemmatimonadota bacterium]|nr:hypothetical protein [Gemmatimonadota bacterium]